MTREELLDAAAEARELLLERATGNAFLAASIATYLLAGLTEETGLPHPNVVAQLTSIRQSLHEATCARCIERARTVS
jgi:hypothetical protein